MGQALVNGNMDKNLRSSGSIIFTHTHIAGNQTFQYVLLFFCGLPWLVIGHLPSFARGRLGPVRLLAPGTHSVTPHCEVAS